MALAVLGLAALVGMAGCSSAGVGIRMPPLGAAPDYQLGEAYQPDAAVGILVRDRSAEPDPERYSICYLNAFQTQPGEREEWPSDLLLDRDDTWVTDPAWPDEVLLDTSSAAQRDRISGVVSDWIGECAASGFDAVEFDNLDSFTRSHGALTFDDNLALARQLVASAHEHGLAAVQKNTAEHNAELRADAGYDFVIAEECAAYAECAVYAETYGEYVIDIEYTDNAARPFTAACSDPASPSSMVLRDRGLLAPAQPGHVFALCP